MNFGHPVNVKMEDALVRDFRGTNYRIAPTKIDKIIFLVQTIVVNVKQNILMLFLWCSTHFKTVGNTKKIKNIWFNVPCKCWLYIENKNIQFFYTLLNPKTT